MRSEILGPELLKVSIEFTSWTVLVEVMETDDFVAIVEFLQFIGASALQVEKIELPATERVVLGCI